MQIMMIMQRKNFFICFWSRWERERERGTKGKKQIKDDRKEVALFAIIMMYM